MHLPLDRVLAEHQITVSRTSTSFHVTFEELEPYGLSAGNWVILPQYLSTDANLIPTGSFFQGYSLYCFQTLSGNNKPLSVAQFGAREFQEAGNVVVFAERSPRPFLVSLRSDRFFFELRTLNGQPVELPDGAELLFSFSLFELCRD